MRDEVRERKSQNFEIKKRERPKKERSERDMECGGMKLKRRRS